MGTCSAWQARGQRVASPASLAPSPRPGAHGWQTLVLGFGFAQYIFEMG